MLVRRRSRRPLLARFVLGALGVVVGGGVACAGGEEPTSLDIAVMPRVILDGTVELSDRSGGRVLIEEVVAHAPLARIASGVGGDRGDVVVDADDPLLFHYDLAERTGFGADIGGERTWTIPVGGGLLAVAFAPLVSEAPLASSSDVDPTLVQNTAVIRGSIAIDVAADFALTEGFGGGASDAVADVDPEGSPADVADVDPEGSPADVADVDPEGSPADVDPEGSPADVDPEGSPADVDPEGSPADVDPEGSPADVDPEGSPADVDPEGSPADVDPEGSPARSTGQVAGFLRSTVRVPFSLVLDGRFERTVVIEPSDLEHASCGEVLPIDLHLAAGELLDGDGLAVLEALAAAAFARGDSTVTLHMSSRAAAAAVVVDVPATIRRPESIEGSSAETGRINVSGGRWRDR
jgi:hypothetical protein